MAHPEPVNHSTHPQAIRSAIWAFVEKTVMRDPRAETPRFSIRCHPSVMIDVDDALNLYYGHVRGLISAVLIDHTLPEGEARIAVARDPATLFSDIEVAANATREAIRSSREPGTKHVLEANLYAIAALQRAVAELRLRIREGLLSHHVLAQIAAIIRNAPGEEPLIRPIEDRPDAAQVAT